MKFLIKMALNRVLNNQRIRRFLIESLFTPGRLNAKQKVSLLNKLRREIVGDIFAYPSVVNNGYLHIERSIDILRSRNLPNLLILDIGAAAGETCILFAKAFPTATIHGFEPIAETFRRLELNVAPFGNIRVHRTALGSVRSRAKINVLNRVTSSSILEADPNSAFNGEDFFEARRTEEIQIDQLDNFVRPGDSIALVKMDVQGFELEVLKGATASLGQTHFVLLEMQNHNIYKGAPQYYELDEFLRNAGFELFEIVPSIREALQIKEFDAIYMNRMLQG